MNTIMNKITRRGARLLLRPSALHSGAYYDSQSGLHVPVHNEKQISVFLNLSKVPTSSDSFIPAQFYKEDSSSEIPEKLRALTRQGITGLLLPHAQFPRDVRNLQTLNNIAPPGFRFFASVTSALSKPMGTLTALHEFHMNNDSADLKETLKQHIEIGTSTALRLGKEVCSDSDHMAVASQVATVIDSTSGVDYLLLTPPDYADEEDVVALCEELIYLDVTGPTIQSRIVIDSCREEVIDETMLAGINKYIVEDDALVDVISDIAKAQGKQLYLS